MSFHALEQIEELAQVLDSSLTVMSGCAKSDVQTGWRVLGASNQEVTCAQSLLSTKPLVRAVEEPGSNLQILPTPET